MLINKDDAEKRLSNPLNLMNRLSSLTGERKRNAMSLFVPSIRKEEEKKDSALVSEVPAFNPFNKPTVVIPLSDKDDKANPSPSSDELIDDVDTKIALQTAHDNSIKLVNDAINMLANKLDSVKADKLPSVIAGASKVVESIRKERAERDKNGKNQDVHLHFYCPEPRSIDSYEVVEVAQ